MSYNGLGVYKTPLLRLPVLGVFLALTVFFISAEVLEQQEVGSQTQKTVSARARRKTPAAPIILSAIIVEEHGDSFLQALKMPAGASIEFDNEDPLNFQQEDLHTSTTGEEWWVRIWADGRIPENEKK